MGYGGRRSYTTRKRGSYKKKSTKSVYNRVGTHLGARQAAIYQNPFSFATTSPKIPDGKMSLSVGQKVQISQSLSCGTNGDLVVALFPGLNCGMTAQHVVEGDTPDDAVILSEQYGYKAHGELTIEGSLPAPTGTGTPIPAMAVAKYAQLSVADESRIRQWRLVSQGLRLSLLNNADENSGFFECIRITSARDAEEYGMILDTATQTPSSKLIPGAKVLIAPQEVNRHCKNMVEHPSYVSGKLRDIHKYLFQLKPQDATHQPVVVEKNYIIGSDAEFGDGKSSTFNPVVKNGLTVDELLQSYVDVQYDMLVVKISGRTVAATGGGNTRILAHLVANHEVVYDEKSALSKFHSECTSAPNFKRVSQAITADVRSARRLKTCY